MQLFLLNFMALIIALQAYALWRLWQVKEDYKRANDIRRQVMDEARERRLK